MSLKVAVQCDPIELFGIEGDSTFALMLEAQARGHEMFYYQTKTLAYEAGRVTGFGQQVKVRDVKNDHFTLGEAARIDLASQQVLLMRQDPPFDMGYITATHLLDMIHPKTLVVNDPTEVRNAPEKLFILRFKDLMPETLISRDVGELDAFRRTHKDVIYKPLYGNGGAGVIRSHDTDQNFSSLMELMMTAYKEPLIAQVYLPEVRKGDKRIILVDGKVAGAINRIPAAHDNRSNMHVGGQAAPTTLTKREHEICEAIGPELKKRGLIFTGIDVIGDYMTEINVTSPTGIRQVKKFGGADIAALIWDAIEGQAVSGLDLVCFDADDTLWHNLIHFDAAETEFGRMMADYMPEAEAKQKIITTESRNVKLYGYGVKSFTLSMIEAAIEISGGAVDTATISKLIALGRTMLDHDMEVLPHVEETLKALHNDYKLLLITKGDLHHQERKVLASGLAHYFEGVEIVSDKKPAAYEKICKRYGGKVHRTLMAGNSIKSDVLPMIHAGGYGVYVPFEITWEHEHEDVPANMPRYFEVKDLRGVVDVVRGII